MAAYDDIWVACNKCGDNDTQHEVQWQDVENYYSEAPPEGYPIYNHVFQVIRCGGCRKLKYRVYTQDVKGDHESGLPYEEQIFPDCMTATQVIRQPATPFGNADNHLIPPTVMRIYRETLAAFGAGIKILAGVGLRATVEAVCRDLEYGGGNLEKRIDNLSVFGHITSSQAEFFHAQRFLGNDAAHEMEEPDNEDIQCGLEIIHGMLTTIYVLPKRAEAIMTRRTQRKQDKAP